MNFAVRLKNPWFWVGLIGVILTAMGVSPETLTSWEILRDSLYALIQNPFMLGSVLVAILGVFIDPTTKGVKDSSRARKYTKPSKMEHEETVTDEVFTA